MLRQKYNFENPSVAVRAETPNFAEEGQETILSSDKLVRFFVAVKLTAFLELEVQFSLFCLNAEDVGEAKEGDQVGSCISLQPDFSWRIAGMTCASDGHLLLTCARNLRRQ